MCRMSPKCVAVEICFVTICFVTIEFVLLIDSLEALELLLDLDSLGSLVRSAFNKPEIPIYRSFWVLFCL